MMNEVISDAVELKRMQKKISLLEAEVKLLKANKANDDKCHKKQTELEIMKLCIIHTSQSQSGARNTRRQTWGGGGGGGPSSIPLHVVSSTPRPSKGLFPIPNDNRGVHLTSGDDDEWHDGFPQMPTEENGTFKVPAKVPPKRSFLAVPTSSYKSPVQRANCKLPSNALYIGISLLFLLLLEIRSTLRKSCSLVSFIYSDPENFECQPNISGQRQTNRCIGS